MFAAASAKEDANPKLCHTISVWLPTGSPSIAGWVPEGHPPSAFENPSSTSPFVELTSDRGAFSLAGQKGKAERRGSFLNFRKADHL
jgi:hypothetical protein